MISITDNVKYNKLLNNMWTIYNRGMLILCLHKKISSTSINNYSFESLKKYRFTWAWIARLVTCALLGFEHIYRLPITSMMSLEQD
jgi:hypothetical protein